MGGDSYLDVNALGLDPIPEKPINNYIPKEMEKVTMNQKGVEATAKALEFIFTVAQAVKDIDQDKKVTVSDAVYILPVAMKVPGMIGAIVDLPAELKDTITPEEKAVLMETVLSMVPAPIGLTPDQFEKILSWIIDGKNILTDIVL